MNGISGVLYSVDQKCDINRASNNKGTVSE